MSEHQNNEAKEFTPLGTYKITENTEFVFPNTEIKISKISDKVFAYQRLDGEDNVGEKIIPSTGELQLEICPIRPLNHPARRTNYVYLQFETPVFLSEGSSATIYLQCPIEIGVFLIHDAHKDSLDTFTCDPQNSRFALYGNPDTGTLCKHSTTPIVSSYEDSTPYINGIIKVEITNALEGGHSFGKVVFPVTDCSIYYKESKAMFDGVKALMKKKLAVEYIDITTEKIQTDWTQAPTYETSTTAKRIDMGVD